LLALAQSNDNEDEQLKFYEQVLGLDAEQPEAKSGRLGIWQRRGDEAYKAGDLETALAAFRTAHLDDKVAEVEREVREREFQAQLKLLNEAEQAKRYEEALEQARQLAEEYSDKRDWTDDLERLQRKNKLDDLYQRALGALENDDRETAQALLVQVVVLEPTYEEVTRYLHFAVTGTDVTKMMQQSVEELRECRQHEKELKRLLENEKNARKKAEEFVKNNDKKACAKAESTGQYESKTLSSVRSKYKIVIYTPHPSQLYKIINNKFVAIGYQAPRYKTTTPPCDKFHIMAGNVSKAILDEIVNLITQELNLGKSSLKKSYMDKMDNNIYINLRGLQVKT
jgi:tetratricopeptide (TPR) repeat protein